MMEVLTKEGIREVGDYSSQAELNVKKEDQSVMVVRAHGISPERRKYLKNLGMEFRDATCPDVGIIAGKVRMYAKKGYVTVIFGDPKHPEVIGLLGYAEAGGHVITSHEEIAALPALGDKVCMVSQSTMFTDEFERLAADLKSRYPKVEIFDTICGATKDRQSDVVELAKQGCQAIVVIGGRHSANTVKLAKLVELQGLPCYHVETAAELDFSHLQRYQTVGVTAGASTPAFLIDEVCVKLEALK
jgi:4-hydroxy-3-methylbut-2-enyl diphosphate reductase